MTKGLSPERRAELARELETLKAERTTREAKGLEIPAWYDHIILAHERQLEDANTGADGTDDNYHGQAPEPWGWAGWAVIGCVLVVAGLCAYGWAVR